MDAGRKCYLGIRRHSCALEDMMKIALIGPTYPMRGGIAHYTTLLGRELSKQHSVLLVSFSRLYPGWLFPGKSSYDPSRAPVAEIGSHPLIDSLNPLTWARVIRRIRAFKPDMVILQWWVAFWAPLYLFLIGALRTKSFRTEIVFICHNVIEHEGNPLKKAASMLVLSKADRLVTHSKAETRKLTALKPGNIRLVTGFHPTYKDIGPAGPGKTLAKAQLGLKGDVLLFFGFIREYKGLNVLLKAMRHVIEDKNVTLLVVGEFWQDKGVYLSQIEDLQLAAHVVLVDAYVPNEAVGVYFAAADLVVQPYLRASGSGVCQLAFGHNRPVIATRVGSLPETVRDGVNGKLVPPNDSLALAAAIIECLVPARLGELTGNAANAKEGFDWSGMVDIITDTDRIRRA